MNMLHLGIIGFICVFRLRDEENNNAALQERGRKDYFQLNELTKEKDKLRKEYLTFMYF